MVVNCFYNKRVNGSLVRDYKKYFNIAGYSYYRSKDEILFSSFDYNFTCFGRASGNNLGSFNTIVCYTIIEFYKGELEKDEENQNLY